MTEEEIRRFCEGKIAYFKIPQHVRFVEGFPMTVTGKIQKFRIREIETTERGLEKVATGKGGKQLDCCQYYLDQAYEEYKSEGTTAVKRSALKETV
jgi:hypothetical protein